MKLLASAILVVGLVCAVVWAQAPAAAPNQPPNQAPQTPLAPGAVPAGAGNAYQRAGQLEARIMSFTAEPASIRPGQSTSLVWLAENPQAGTTIEPDLGRVTSRGSRQVTPKATTTYTLTVRGPNNTVLTRAVTVTVAGTTPVNAAPADAAARAVPRMPDGKPDLSGVYGGGGGGGGRGAGGAAAAPAGPVLKAGAEKFRIVRGPEDTGATANCMPLIAAQAFGVPYQFQIVQGLNYVVIMHEYPGVFRIIPTNGATHPVDPDPSWVGTSIGRWEGDTLVVDTIGFNDKTELSGYRHSEALHIVERFRRTAFETVQWEATIEDPNVFEKPWVVTRNFTVRPDLVKIDEFVCENNRDYRPLFGK